MNYDLALELKNAGFPQTGKGHAVGITGGLVEHGGDIYFPTLDEFVEACGEGFKSLTKVSDFWEAYGMKGSIFADHKEAGRTPEEAVARLWLALNKKEYMGETL